MNRKIILLQGLPASGKSSWAHEFVSKEENQKKWVRVNRDDLRTMSGTYWVPSREFYITHIEQLCAESALSNGYNVVIDATNLNPKTVEYWEGFAKTYNYDFEKMFINTSVEECVKRDNERVEGKVKESVIRNFYNKYNDLYHFND